MARLSLIAADRRVILGSIVALGSAFGYGGNSVMAKWLVEDYAPPLVVSTFSLLFGTVIMLAMVGRESVSSFKLSARTHIIIFLTGASTTAAITSFYFALQRAPVVVVSPIASTTPVVTLVLAHLFLQRLEKVTLRMVAGTMLVVTGVVLVIMGRLV